jgi:hypothetical protein
MSPTQTQLHQSNTPSVAEHAVENWITYKSGNMSFKYPTDWQVEPIYYRTPPEEEAGKPAYELGETISRRGEPPSSSRTIVIGGRQAGCESMSSSCECFTIYVAEYTCGPDAETFRTFDLFLKTIRNDDASSAFQVVFPAAQDRLRTNTRYTIRWRTKSGLRIPRVKLIVHDTSMPWREGTVLDAAGVPNTGRYEWLIPESVNSPGPYLIEISFVKPIKATPPALSAGRLYEGQSNPFYIY